MSENAQYIQYKQEFETIIYKIDHILNFDEVYESETSYKFKKKQGACPFCGSGTRGTKDSTGAFYYYASSNLGKCYSCGTSSGITKLVMHQHNSDYKQAIHYIAKQYLHTELVNPFEEIKFNYAPKVKIEISERKKISEQEAAEEEQKKLKSFDYIKNIVLANTDKSEAEKFLLSRFVVVSDLPENSYHQASPYKNLPSGVVFFDTEMRCLNKRYITNELPAGVGKTFTYGQMLNSLYDKTYRPNLNDIYITEGVINALSLYQAGKSAISLFASTNYISDVQKFKPYFNEKNIIIAFDADKAGLQSGIKQAKFIIKHFSVQSVSFIIFPNDIDANDLLKNGELCAFIENPFNYAHLDEKIIESELTKIDADRLNYIPDLKPSNYYSRQAHENEKEGSFLPVKEDKIPEEIIDKFKGSPQLNQQVFKNYGISYLKEYTVISKKYAHVHQSTTERPIFLIKQTDEDFMIWRPFSGKPYQEFEKYGKIQENLIFGLSQIEKQYEINRTNTDLQSPELDKITIAFNMVDLLNLSSIEENPVLPLNKVINYDDFEKLQGFAKEIYQVPTNNKTDIATSRKIGLKHIDIRTMHVPQLNGTYLNSVSEFLKEYNDSRVYKKRLNTALPFKFWEYEKGDYDINIIKLRNFLSANGYYTYKNVQERQGYMYIKIDGRIVRKMDKDTFNRHIETFVDSYLEKRGENVKLRNKVSISSRFSENNLSGIKEAYLDFENSAKDFQNWFFKDGFMWTVTREGIKKQSQQNLQKYVWDDELLNYPSNIKDPAFRIFYQDSYLKLLEELNAMQKNSKEFLHKKMEIAGMKPTQIYDIEILDKDNYFLQFLFLTSFVYYEDIERAGIEIKKNDFWYKLEEKKALTKDQIFEIKIHLINKLTWLGYMMKDYKSMADDYGLAILDAIDNEEGGRRKGAAGGGKSIITKAIKQVKRTLILKAEAEDFCENKHRYENYDGEKVIVADDMHLKSRIGNMLTDFSEGIEVNPKHKRPRKIPFIESPKIIVTRNYIDDEGERVDRRLGRMFVFPFFHDNKGGRHKVRRRPNDYFGRMLFQDDTEEDKSKLVNLFANCYMANLQYGEINPPMFDMEKFRMINRIGEPLIEFLDTYFESGENFGYIDRVPFLNKFKEDQNRNMSPYQRTTLYSTSQKFKTLVETYCELRGYIFNPEKLITDKANNRIMLKSETQTNKHGHPIASEHFYIGLKDGIIKEPETIIEEHIYEAIQGEMPF